MWRLLVAAAAAAAPSGAFTAVDFAWRANGTAATSLTIRPGETVAFAYPSGDSFHNLRFEGSQPACTGVPPDPRPPGWNAECRFDNPGTYRFVCDVHEGMTGRVIVAVPTPAPTPGPDGTVPPEATPTPAPTTTPPQQLNRLAVKLAPKQRGTRVRGSVAVERAGSRLEVVLRAGKRNVGRFVRAKTAVGTVRFSVRVNRKALKRRLALSVRVSLRPPGAAKPLRRTLRTTLIGQPPPRDA